MMVSRQQRHFVETTIIHDDVSIIRSPNNVCMQIPLQSTLICNKQGWQNAAYTMNKKKN